MSGHPKYFADEPDPSAWLKVLAEVRRMAPRQGYCFLHVQAVNVAIDHVHSKVVAIYMNRWAEKSSEDACCMARMVR